MKPVTINFRRTEMFYVPATILLFAELDRIIGLSTLHKPISVIDPIARRPREVLKQIGLHQLTGDRSDIIPTRDDVVYWKVSKGHNQSGDKLAVLEDVAVHVNRTQKQKLDVGRVWRGVSEAVANTVDHAYIKPRGDGHAEHPSTRWWMFSQVRGLELTFAVCDLGCGYRATINETLPESIRSAAAKLFKGSNRDALAILTAMAYGRSGTHKGHRGKGSRDALSVLEQLGVGQLVIMSNTGWVRCSFHEGEELQRESGDIRLDIKGTIVWWKLPISEVK